MSLTTSHHRNRNREYQKCRALPRRCIWMIESCRFLIPSSKNYTRRRIISERKLMVAMKPWHSCKMGHRLMMMMKSLTNTLLNTQWTLQMPNQNRTRCLWIRDNSTCQHRTTNNWRHSRAIKMRWSRVHANQSHPCTRTRKSNSRERNEWSHSTSCWTSSTVSLSELTTSPSEMHRESTRVRTRGRYGNRIDLYSTHQFFQRETLKRTYRILPETISPRWWVVFSSRTQRCPSAE